MEVHSAVRPARKGVLRHIAASAEFIRPTQVEESTES